MGFLPHTIKLYPHNSWSAEHLFRLNNAVMRSEQGTLSEQFKYRLALVVSRDNQCTYCTARHAEAPMGLHGGRIAARAESGRTGGRARSCGL